MEAENWPIREEIITQHSGFILNLKVIDSGKVMLTFGSNGQVQIFSRQKNQWACKSCNKLFDCPVVANDTTQYLGTYQIALLGYDGKIKIAKLTPELELIVTEAFNFELNVPLVCCTWSYKKNELVLSTETKELVVVNVAQKSHKIFKIEKSDDMENLIWVRRGIDMLYINCGSQIRSVYEESIDLNDKLLDQQTLIKIEKENIIDFVVSEEEVYWTVAILTEKRLIFTLVTDSNDNSIIEVSSFNLDDKSICSRLGWGKSFSELGLYQCINGSIQTRCFIKRTNGRWEEQLILLPQGQQKQEE